MDTWHYHAQVFTLKDLLHPNELNNLGDIGWELIALKELRNTQQKQPRWLLVFKKLDRD